MEIGTPDKVDPGSKTIAKGRSLAESDLIKAKLLLPPKLVHLANEEGWHLFFDPDNHVWIRLNDSGKQIIETLETSPDLDEAINRLCAHYRQSADSIREKVADFIRSMIDAGIIHLDAYVTREFVDSPEGGHPVNVYFSNTERCNLSCVYCYNAENRKRFGKFREEMTTAETVQALEKLWDFGASAVAFCGGEPMMRPDLFDVARYAKNRGFRIALVTNGTRITENLAPAVAELFDLVWVSLDSHIKEEHEALRGKGSFDRTMRAVRLLANYNPKRLVINSVVCNVNVKSMPETHRLLVEEIGVGQHRMGAFLPSKEVVRDKNNNPINPVIFDDEYNKFLVAASLRLELSGDEFPPLAVDEHNGLIVKHAPRKNQCGAANGDIHMVSNGDIYPCTMMYKKEFRAGNILEEDIRKIYRESAVMKKCRETTVDSIKQCGKCFVKYVCAGGCRGAAYNMYGDIKAYHKDMCPLLKKSAIDSLWADTQIPFNKMEQAAKAYEEKRKDIKKENDYTLSDARTI
ncbi:MAG TPA: PqqD family peptide modification chaperone [Candidatus Acidoferrales bacterium]|nr:PqqD family peptide modification chaperone [Candidatus Acidoferrales bacterium]